MEPAEMYVRGVKRKLKLYHAAWLPNREYALGDVGVLKDDFFEPVSSLKILNITFDVRPDPKPSELEVISDKGVSISFKAAGQLNPMVPSVPMAEAGVAVDFGSEGAFLIQASDVHEAAIANIAKLEDDVITAFKAGAWKLDWAVITQLLQTSNAQILVSQSSNAKIEMSASGQIGAGSFKLSDPRVKLSVLHQSGDLIRVDRAEDVTPLFQLVRIHRRIFGPPVPAMEKGLMGVRELPELTPQLAQSDPRVAKSLYLDLVH